MSNSNDFYEGELRYQNVKECEVPETARGESLISANDGRYSKIGIEISESELTNYS